jgi:hypothetical protein
VRVCVCGSPSRGTDTAAVTNVLKLHETTLRLLFFCLCAGGAGPDTKRFLTLDAWLRFHKALGFIQTDLTLRDAVLCFSWARMRVTDGQKQRGHLRETCLPLESFYEALVRVAVLKALPDTSEMASAGLTNCATYVLRLQEGDAADYACFLKEEHRYSQWGEVRAFMRALLVCALTGHSRTLTVRH